MKSFYITTAIDYANGRPHIGHAYEKTLTDVIARVRRLQGQPVHFLTGLDEHGQKVQASARKQGIEPQAFCDNVAKDFMAMCETLNISNDDFIRTTEPRHKEVVRGILQKLFDEGQIYQKEYVGFYSERQEQFLQEKDKVDGEWPEIFGEVKEITETNYFFKLGQYQQWLIDFLKENEEFIFPRFRAKQVLEFLKEPLNDLCISRPKERLEWGIPLPFDEEFVTYVWFDALVNYLSATGYPNDGWDQQWPADFHVIGKDILVPPHAVYWPIMLHAAGIPLPKSLLVHGWWNISGQKMSKTLGNIVDPFELSERFGADSLRYFFIREMNVGQDSDFSETQFIARHNSELANGPGNQMSRLLNMAKRYAGQKVPTVQLEEEPEAKLKAAWESCVAEVQELFDGFQFHTGLAKLSEFSAAIDSYLETRQPWILAKSEDPQDKLRVETSLAYLAEALRLYATLINPVTPGLADRMLGLIGAEPLTQWEGQLAWSSVLEGKDLGDKTILVPRIVAEG